MSQHSANSIDLGREIPLCKDRVAFRIRQIFSCLAFLSSPSWQGDKKIPSEAAIEIQHALAHLALLTDSLSKNHQYKRLRQAISHLDRALIDFLKIFTLAKVKNNRKSITFLENWLGTRQKEYLEHTTSDQSPDSTISLETDLISIQTYSRLVGISFDTPTLDFKGEDLTGNKWYDYSVELENWLESDLMLGGLAAQKSTSNLFILLKTLWKLDATALAAQNMITQVKTLKIISALGKKHQWYGNLWSRIDNALQNPNPDLSVITALYRDFLNYFHITPWRALTI